MVRSRRRRCGMLQPRAQPGGGGAGHAGNVPGSGSPWPGSGLMLVLDAGAFVAVERGDRDVVALVKREHLAGRPPVTSRGVVAQVWRGGPGGRQNSPGCSPGCRLRRSMTGWGGVRGCCWPAAASLMRSTRPWCASLRTATIFSAPIRRLARARGGRRSPRRDHPCVAQPHTRMCPQSAAAMGFHGCLRSGRDGRRLGTGCRYRRPGGADCRIVAGLSGSGPDGS